MMHSAWLRRGRYGLFVALAMAVGSPAHAYCRKTTKSGADASYDPKATGTCGARKGALPLYWPTDCVEYRVIVEPELLTKGTFTLERARAIVADAAKTWVEAPCAHIRGAVRSPTIRLVDVDVARCGDGPVGAAARTANEIRFRAEPPSDVNNLAVTTNIFVPESGMLREAQIAVFQTPVLDAYRRDPDGTERTFAAVLRHEIGHFLGLAHSERDGAIMYAFYNQAPPAGLTVDDIDGICAAYDPDFPVAAGCDEAPQGHADKSLVDLRLVILVTALVATRRLKGLVARPIPNTPRDPR